MSVIIGEIVLMKVIKHEHMDFIPLEIEELGIQSVLIVCYREFHSW